MTTPVITQVNRLQTVLFAVKSAQEQSEEDSLHKRAQKVFLNKLCVLLESCAVAVLSLSLVGSLCMHTVTDSQCVRAEHSVRKT